MKYEWIETRIMVHSLSLYICIYIYIYVCVCVSLSIYICIYISYIDIYLRYYHHLLMGPDQLYSTLWINIFQDLHEKSSHSQVLMQFSKRARETAWQISLGTCCKSFWTRYEVAPGPYFNERWFSFWKIRKFWRSYVFPFNLKISIIMLHQSPFRFL